MVETWNGVLKRRNRKNTKYEESERESGTQRLKCAERWCTMTMLWSEARSVSASLLLSEFFFLRLWWLLKCAWGKHTHYALGLKLKDFRDLREKQWHEITQTIKQKQREQCESAFL